MNPDWDQLSVHQLSEGLVYDTQAQAYQCLFCSAHFAAEEVFPQADGRYLTAVGAAQLHLSQAHGSALQGLLTLGRKDAGFTERQAQVLLEIAQGKDDRQSAAALGISPSTLRHMRFTFRERARQARLCLAILDLALSKHHPKDGLVPIHKGATMVDDRYQITQEEEEKILRTSFESFEPLKLKQLSLKEKRKIIVLRRISACFEPQRRYSEREVNEILRPIYDDFVLIRRYLIEYGFLQRTKDCRAYWRESDQ